MAKDIKLLKQNVGKSGRSPLDMFECFCGNEFIAARHNVKSGSTRSCGCLKRSMTIAKNTTHGLRNNNIRLYQIWKAMRYRCDNTKCNSYKDYGGRGIKVCEEWYDYPTFYNWALANGYNDNLSIERVDVNKGYNPSNCKWATMQEQSRNTRATIGWENVNIVRDLYNNTTMSTSDLSNMLCVSVSTIVKIVYNKTYFDSSFKTVAKGRVYKSKIVERLDESGNVLDVFCSIEEASKKFGLSEYKIRMVCLGRKKHYNGLFFRYKD